MKLGRVGVHSLASVVNPLSEVGEAAKAIEAAGYGALWYPEGPETFSRGSFLLSATREIPVGSGIANIYARDPVAMATGAATLGEAFPDRFILGLGVSHRPMVEERGHEYAPPLTAMREYLDAMDAVGATPAVTRVLAALRPGMLGLAAARTDGAQPLFVPVEHTARARERMGPDALLCVEVSFVLDDDRRRGREIAWADANMYLGWENYRNNLLDLGITEDELKTDELLERITPVGDIDTVAERVKQHLDAGADHVCVRPLPAAQLHVEQLVAIAPVLTAL